jgi:hypothetical protein
MSNLNPLFQNLSFDPEEVTVNQAYDPAKRFRKSVS